jgi:SNF2-related domain
MISKTIKIAVGGYYRNLTLSPMNDDLVKVTFGYNRDLVETVKELEGARWNPEGKFWTIKRSQRNIFVLSFLQGHNPYEPYEKELFPYESKRPIYSHQLYDIRCGITRKHMIFAVDMGAGKTLIAIEVMEYSGFKGDQWIWVGPKSALRAVEIELLKWESKVWPMLITYDSLKKLIANWPKDKPAPRGIILDELQKIKTPTSQRSQAAKYICDNMRKEYDRDSYILGLSGTPAPKSPADWFWLCEVICPGYIKESNIFKFKNRLGLIQQKESVAGGTYPELISWYDDEKKCKYCGKYADDMCHSPMHTMEPNYHSFTPSKNEVKILYERMKGLVVVQFKRDVLKELPDKIYRVIQCTPTSEVLRAAKLIVAKSSRVITANILLRELSDGFMYENQEIGHRICEQCLGKQVIQHPVFISYTCEYCWHTSENEVWNCEKCEKELSPKSIAQQYQDITCPSCSGTGETIIYQREAIEVPCPKDDVFIDILEECEDGGRCLTYAGFTASVNRCVRTALKQKWNVIRVDGRGFQYFDPNVINPPNISDVGMLQLFQDKKRDVERCVFIGQADSAGIGITLTETPVAFYYSNTFKAESRIQSEDRPHRPGMDLNKGLTIVDCYHLPTDKLVHDNLKKKKDLQSLSMGDMQKAIG